LACAEAVRNDGVAAHPSALELIFARLEMLIAAIGLAP
jgi:hypothetical protein